MMQTLWQKQSSDYKQQQSQLQQQQQKPAISFNRPSPSPQSFCGTNAGENDQFVTFDGLSGEKENFTTTNLHNENGLLRTLNCSSITGHGSQWGFSNQPDFSWVYGLIEDDQPNLLEDQNSIGPNIRIQTCNSNCKAYLSTPNNC